MKSKHSFALLVLFTCLLYACSHNRKEAREAQVPARDSVPAQNIDKVASSSAAVENKKDTAHKFIRTADIKFKVKNVVNTTYDIENIVNDQGGFVTYTNLNSIVNNKTVVPVSADSSLETTLYTYENTMTIRVPNTKLDTTLKSIAGLIYFIDHRTISANDVALSLLANKLTQERMARSEQRLVNAIDNRGKKLEETNAAEETLLTRAEQKDQTKISNLALEDQINYSTLTLNLYQRESVFRELVSNDKDITAFTPPLTTRLRDAFMEGWAALASILVFFASIWWLILLLPVAYWGYKRINDRLSKQTATPA